MWWLLSVEQQDALLEQCLHSWFDIYMEAGVCCIRHEARPYLSRLLFALKTLPVQWCPRYSSADELLSACTYNGLKMANIVVEHADGTTTTLQQEFDEYLAGYV